MRVGMVTSFDPDRLKWAQDQGLGSIELLVSEDDAFHPLHTNWESEAARVREVIDAADLRLSSLGGFYENNLDPSRAEHAGRKIRAVIDLASYWGMDRVAGFAGRWPLDAPLEDSMPAFEAFWEPMARYAADRGIRVALEHCPMGPHHLPPGGINMITTPGMWDRVFCLPWADILGIEWDASHLIGMRIDPVLNIHQYGRRIFHVHAKDARVERHIYERYGIYHPGAIEHCFPGLGDADWPAIVKALYRVGYDSDLNLEGWHDAVYNDRDGRNLERQGLLIGRDTLKPLVDGR